MRDELRQRIRNTLDAPRLSAEGIVTSANMADDILEDFESFMREHGLKMMARPKRRETHLSDEETILEQEWANDWWDAAPLTPWSVPREEEDA